MNARVEGTFMCGMCGVVVKEHQKTQKVMETPILNKAAILNFSCVEETFTV